MITQEKIDAIVNNEKIAMTFINLWVRWQDEKEYEDINEYGKVMFDTLTKQLPNIGAEYLSVNKRPFGIRVKLDGRAWNISVTRSGRGFSFGVMPVK